MQWYDYGARMYDAALGRWSVVDPLAEEYISWSPYQYVMNDPINLFDINGASTYIDENGNVIAVYDDENESVYQMNNDDLPDNYATYEGEGELYQDEEGNLLVREKTRLSGGEKIGETEHWNEFRAHDNETGDVLNRVEGRIMVGESWSTSLFTLNNEAIKMGLEKTAIESTPGGKFDIKVNKDYAPYGPGTGKLLKGKYASARSAGNYLAGMNAASATNVFGDYVTK